MADDKPNKGSAPAGKARRKPSPMLTGLVAALITGVVGTSAGGGYVWNTARQASTAAAEACQAKIAAGVERERGLELRVADALQESRLLEVRVDLARATNELAARNFGTAKQHLEAAKAHYANIEPAPSADLDATLNGLQLRVGDNLESQLTRMVKVTDQVDALLTND